jgi:MOSC domain-containing protein YiiM
MNLASVPDLDAGLDHIRQAPTDAGTLELIVRRPAVDEREVLDEAQLDPVAGVVGDTWAVRPSTRTTDGSAHPDMQLNVMSARAIALVSPDPSRWALAGDQLFVDLDLSEDNLPAGTRLAIGTAVIEVTDQPHRGCAKFSQRFGVDALRLVNSEVGVALRLRGINAKVVQAGIVRRGDVIAKL